MNKGFTIVELIAVIAILGILAIIVTPAYDNVSDNVRKQNYETRKEEIKQQTISFIERYAKDKIYDGTNNICACFTPEFLIRNGIITSDDNKEEYIKDDFKRVNYSGHDNEYIKVTYDTVKKKLYAMIQDETSSEGYEDKYAFDKFPCTKTDAELFKN